MGFVSGEMLGMMLSVELAAIVLHGMNISYCLEASMQNLGNFCYGLINKLYPIYF